MRSIYILFRWKHPTWKSTEAVGDPMISNRDVGVKLSNIKNCTPYSMGSKANGELRGVRYSRLLQFPNYLTYLSFERMAS